MRTRRSWIGVVALLTFAGALFSTQWNTAAAEPAADRVVDFRYALPWWQSLVCLPDDGDKPLVGKEGQYFFDYGHDGPRRFAFSIAPQIEGSVEWVRQETATPRPPILKTWKDADGVDVLEEAFLVVPAAGDPDPALRLERLGGEVFVAGWDAPKEPRHKLDWAKPTVPCDPAFRNIALGKLGEPIIYRLRVPPGSRLTIVTGFCEGVHDQPGQRPLTVSVEGAASRTVDPVSDFGRNRPGVYNFAGQDTDGDGILTIQVEAASGASDRHAILNALWAFMGQVPPADRIIAGLETDTAYAFASGGVERFPSRRHAVIVTLKNRRSEAVVRQPVLRIEGIAPVSFHKESGVVAIGPATRILASSGIAACEKETNAWSVKLAPVPLAPGEEKQVVVTILRHCYPPYQALTVAEASERRRQCLAWWENADLPYQVVQVPDPGIQGMIESCVRNIWQAREIKKGLPAFHVGPTVYRCLWMVDGAFLLETAAVLGRAREARAGIEYELSFQDADGGFHLKRVFWKEDGLVLWTAIRHAFLTDDQAWLRQQWPALRRIVAHIQQLRREAQQDPNALNYGLLPPGDVDGGISTTDKPEYSNSYWCLIGLKSAVSAAAWLGETAQAEAWQKEYDEFQAAFHRAAQRDLRKDPYGNAYLPTMMGNLDNHVPQRGQWAFCHAVYPGELFPVGDPIVSGNLAMLRATKRQGLVFNTGWMQEGIWTYFASFYGHALLWERQGAEAAQVLYDFANHAVPTRVWREEQKPLGKGLEEVGDMPHNWASAEFIRLATHLVALERGDELHLFEGLPRQWVQPGMKTRLNGVLTRFGPVHLDLEVSQDGATAALRANPLPRARRIVVHLGGWATTQADAEITLPSDQAVAQTIQLRR
jgi:hypothetical protein